MFQLNILIETRILGCCGPSILGPKLPIPVVVQTLDARGRHLHSWIVSKRFWQNADESETTPCKTNVNHVRPSSQAWLEQGHRNMFLCSWLEGLIIGPTRSYIGLLLTYRSHMKCGTYMCLIVPDLAPSSLQRSRWYCTHISWVVWNYFWRAWGQNSVSVILRWTWRKLWMDNMYFYIFPGIIRAYISSYSIQWA